MLLEKIQDFIIDKTGNHDLAYYITCCIYLICAYAPIIVFGFIFRVLPFVIISAFVFNIIRKYCGGFHCTINGKCITISSIIIILCGYVAQNCLNVLWVSIVLCLFAIKDLYIKAPFDSQIIDVPLKDRWYNNKPFSIVFKRLNINTKKYDVPYDKEWYRKGMIKWIVISLFFVLLFLYLKLYLYTSCILWSIILCDITLFLNKDDFL